MDTYGKRLEVALNAKAPKDRAWLADKIGITVQALSQVIIGKTKALTAYNHEFAVQALECSGFWLATGQGEMQPSRTPTVVSAANPALAQVENASVAIAFNDAVRVIAHKLMEVDEASGRRAMGVLADLATDPQDFERLARATLAVIETGKRPAKPYLIRVNPYIPHLGESRAFLRPVLTRVK